jgi:hypothetical protein
MMFYITLPKSWQWLTEMSLLMQFKEGNMLTLNCGLYGLKQSPHNLFGFSKNELEICGFKQSEHDP